MLDCGLVGAGGVKSIGAMIPAPPPLVERLKNLTSICGETICSPVAAATGSAGLGGVVACKTIGAGAGAGAAAGAGFAATGSGAGSSTGGTSAGGRGIRTSATVGLAGVR